MNRLPPELVSEIIMYLQEDGTRLSPYAAVYQTFQSVVERKTFKSLCITSDDLPYLTSICHRYPHRLNALSSIKFTIILPRYSAAKFAQYESEYDKRINNFAFTGAWVGLFKILASKRAPLTDRLAYLKINLEGVHSPSDFHILSPTAKKERKLAARRAQATLAGGGEMTDLRYRRYFESVLEFPPNLQLPQVPATRSVQLEDSRRLGYQRTHAPSVITVLAAALPGLGALIWATFDEAPRMFRIPVRAHHALPRTLESLSVPGLCEFSLKLQLDGETAPNTWTATWMPWSTTAQLRARGIGPPLIPSLGRFLHLHLHTRGLRHVFLGSPLCADESIFTPLHAAGDHTLWPALRDFELDLDPVTPRGDVYFGRGPRTALTGLKEDV